MGRLLLIVMVVLAGCTKPDKSSDTTLVGFLDANIPHLDPIHSTNRYSSVVNSNIFEGLYHYHYYKRPITIEPSLAESMPVVSTDGLTYTIKIQKGVLFQDNPAFPNGKGRELTAQDFIYSWKRLADAKNKALGWWVFDGLIEGLNQWREDLRNGKADFNAPVSGLQSPDSHTLVIKLTRPSFQFVHFLAMPVTMAMAKEVVDHYGNEIANHPVGTGPYEMESWTRNTEIKLKKNKNFRTVLFPIDGSTESKDKGKSLPLAENVTLKISSELQPLWLSFLKGELDYGIIPKDNFDQVFTNNALNDDVKQKGINIHYQHRPDVTFIAFNMEHPILGKNKNLRKAFATSIDRKLLLEKFYNNRGIVSEGPLPPGFDGYDSNYKSNLQFDIEKAKEYLRLAGYPEGKGLPVFDYEMSNSATWSRQFAEFIKDQWAQIGIQIKLNPNTWPQFDQKIKTKKAAIFEMAWMADYPDSENFLQLFYSKNISPGSNNSNYINRAYDELYNKAVVLAPGLQRNTYIKQMVEFINEEVPSIFLIHRIFRLPYHAWLENYNEFPIIYDYLQYLRVDAKERDELKKAL